MTKKMLLNGWLYVQRKNTMPHSYRGSWVANSATLDEASTEAMWSDANVNVVQQRLI